MSYPAVVLIADDLTGALDSIAPFAALGLGCVVSVAPSSIGTALALLPDVLSVNLGTRELPPEEARARAEAAAREMMRLARPETIWFKKIDSRLKGPIAAEIAGLAAVLPVGRVVLCPAIPELGRHVSQGVLRGIGVVRGLPVAETVGLDLPCDVPDATSDSDLDRLVKKLPPGSLLAGARGLASALARRLCPGCRPLDVHMRRGSLGIVVGSRDPVTLAQVEMLVIQGGMARTPAPDGSVPATDSPRSFLVQATPGTGAEGPVVAARLAEGIALRIAGLETLVLTGGETAAAVLTALGVGALRVQGEVLPGLPLCNVVDRPDLPDLITKSGGFGPPDTLLRLWQAAGNLEGQTTR